MRTRRSGARRVRQVRRAARRSIRSGPHAPEDVEPTLVGVRTTGSNCRALRWCGARSVSELTVVRLLHSPAPLALARRVGTTVPGQSIPAGISPRRQRIVARKWPRSSTRMSQPSSADFFMRAPGRYHDRRGPGAMLTLRDGPRRGFEPAKYRGRIRLPDAWCIPTTAFDFQPNEPVTFVLDSYPDPPTHGGISPSQPRGTPVSMAGCRPITT